MAKYTVARAFRIGDKEYKVGDDFDTEALEIPAKRAGMMEAAGKIKKAGGEKSK